MLLGHLSLAREEMAIFTQDDLDIHDNVFCKILRIANGLEGCPIVDGRIYFAN